MMPDAFPIVHALSFDIEDWFHIIDVDSVKDPGSWDSFPSIVEEQTKEIIELLKEFRVTATFFILGWIAERYPDLVRRIADQGHEIGTHSFWHRKIFDLSPNEFHEDLVDSIDVLEQHRGVKVKGFRAPSFSIIPGTEWAFDVIKKVGLAYDASLFPARRAHGGYPCQRAPHMRECSKSGNIPELPMSVLGIGPVKLCFSGGGYFRLLPASLIARGIRATETAGRSAVLYLHPRDFATNCPRVSMSPYRRFKCHVGQSNTTKKLRKLLANFRFSTCYEVLRRHSLVPNIPVTAEGSNSSRE
jgi:polysaccharide deacetylase family protein (PEP-CTERM system associated)